jgi:hypothetical protein
LRFGKGCRRFHHSGSDRRPCLLGRAGDATVVWIIRRNPRAWLPYRLPVRATADRAWLEQADLDGKTEQTQQQQAFPVKDSRFLRNEANHILALLAVTANRNSTYPARSLLPEG